MVFDPKGSAALRLDYSSNSDDETCGTALLIPHWKAELERLDPMHRYAKNLRAYEPAWKDQCSKTQTLWEWLEDNPTFSLPECPRQTLDTQRVQYLDKESREAYKVDVKDGHFRRSGETFFTGEGDWIFVLSSDKILYINRKERGEFHHTSFLGGESCLAAGWMTVTDGRLVDLLPHSGHYRPSDRHLRFLLRHLQTVGVDLQKVRCDAQRLVHVTRSPEKTKRSNVYYMPADSVLNLLQWKDRSMYLQDDLERFVDGRAARGQRVVVKLCCDGAV